MPSSEAGPASFRFRHDGPMSTVIDIRVEPAGGDPQQADAVDRTVIGEIERLESVFSAFRPDSDLCRWRDGRTEASPELAEVLVDALAWQELTGGRFNPLAGELTGLWREAEPVGREPDPAELSDMVASLRDPRYSILDGSPTRTGDCSRLNLNALAKGHIVDRAVEAAMARHRPSRLMVSAGGDLRVEVADSDPRIKVADSDPRAKVADSDPRAKVADSDPRIKVADSDPRAKVADSDWRIEDRHPLAIENPLRPYDNEPPLLTIDLERGAAAGSGPARRGFHIGGRSLGHLIDPRTGRPARGPASVTVVADRAATADVVATAAAIGTDAEAVDLADRLDETGRTVAVLVVNRDGTIRADDRWRDRFGSPPERAPGRPLDPG